MFLCNKNLGTIKDVWMSMKDMKLMNTNLVGIVTNMRANTRANMKVNMRANMKGVEYEKLNLIKIDHLYIVTGMLFLNIFVYIFLCLILVEHKY